MLISSYLLFNLKSNFSERPFLKIILLLSDPFLNSFWTSSGSRFTSIHSAEQQFSNLSLQLSHWINNKWHASFAQFVCVSAGEPHWWQTATTSSEIRSPLLSLCLNIFSFFLRSLFIFLLSFSLSHPLCYYLSSWLMVEMVYNFIPRTKIHPSPSHVWGLYHKSRISGLTGPAHR